MNALTPEISGYQLNHRYTRLKGRVFMTGTQALVRVLLDQARRDQAAGLKTAGFVSGYRGSPLGAVDLELWRASDFTKQAGVEFLPAVNEDLAATAVLGTQQVETNPDSQVVGVFALWYGKGPGVDRSGDALKHGNAYGSSPHGGVLVVAGDDHGCVSSSMPHQSDAAFLSWFMPTLNPATIAEYLEFGEYGYALSRFSGMWVGFKAISETVESAASIVLPNDRRFLAPTFDPPEDGLHYRWSDLPGPHIEERLEAKKNAVAAFADANPIDRHIYKLDKAPFGIVTTGKAHLDLMEALRLLGIDEQTCRELGIDIYKVGMVWPLARRDALNFVRGKREVLVIEEKRGIIESQFKEYFYDWPGDKPKNMVGKRDENGDRLIPWIGELSPRLLIPIIAKRLDTIFPGQNFKARAEKITSVRSDEITVSGTTRTPYFCSGCPHNTSTRVPDGSKALAGIGCHVMASWMDRETSSLIQMGGEGVNWVGSSKFTGNNHIFQNLGDGTWYHSGSMAIRQAVAAETNITFKILFNDAVAMTGGQPVDGAVSVEAIAHICRAEGVERIALASDDPAKFSRGDFPPGVTIDHRRRLDAIQRDLREVKGVSVLIYEQTCATEKRRLRKRGQLPDPQKFAVINELVCEGCGDCGVASNCLSVEPVEPEFGRKRRINLSTCNKDFTCVDGFCPSFVTVEGGERRKQTGAEIEIIHLSKNLPDPRALEVGPVFDLLVTGVGGTGVVTVGALVTMAAHLDGKGASVLDFTGFAQKFGPVLSFIRLADDPAMLNQVRIDRNRADAVIGCDILVSSSANASSRYRAGTKAVVNLAKMPTGDMIRHPDTQLRIDRRLDAIHNAIGRKNVDAFDANLVSEKLMGDTVFANIILLGFAWQNGLVPVTHAAMMRAIELNGVAVPENRKAFAIGRIAADDLEAVSGLLTEPPKSSENLDEILNRREAFLEAYQDARYGAQYRARIDAFGKAERIGRYGSEKLMKAAARTLFKLMAYKDEYEVARLHTETGFEEGLRDQFQGEFKLEYHLAPPFMPGRKDARGLTRKRAFGSWVQTPLGILAKMKRFRGTPFDIFGYTAERKMERGLIAWFEDLLEQCQAKITGQNAETWLKILEAPMRIRGFGPVKQEAVREIKAEIANLLSTDAYEAR